MLSIVISTYNRLELLKDLLSEIEKNFSKEGLCEFIVVDHGSTDKTWQFLCDANYSWLSKYKIEQNKGTPSFPRNFGADHSNGEYILFLDSDDFIYEELISIYDQVRGEEAPAVIYARAKTFGTSMSSILPRKVKKFNGDLSSSLIWGNSIPLLTAAVKREVHFQVGGWDESLFLCGIEDFDYFFRIALSKERFLFVDKVLGDYRINENSLSSNKSRERLLILRVYRKLMFRYPKKLPIFIAAYIKQLTAYCLIKLGFLGN